MKTRFYVLLIVMVVCGIATSGYAQDCNLAKPPSTDGAIVIDARNGSLDGRRQYRVGDETQVLLIHKNPFRYGYALKIEESVIQEDAIGKFLAFAKISVDAPADPPAGGAPPVGGATPTPVRRGDRPTHQSEYSVDNSDGESENRGPGRDHPL